MESENREFAEIISTDETACMLEAAMVWMKDHKEELHSLLQKKLGEFTDIHLTRSNYQTWMFLDGFKQGFALACSEILKGNLELAKIINEPE